MFQKHSSLYCVSPEIGKWWIRQMLFASVLAITELVSPVLLRRFDRVWLCSLRYNVRQQWLISFTITTARPSDQYDSVVWLLTFIKSKSVHQANSNRISHKKDCNKKVNFNWVVMSFTEQRRYLEREWEQQNVKARIKSATFHKEGEKKKYIYLFLTNDRWN